MATPTSAVGPASAKLARWRQNSLARKLLLACARCAKPRWRMTMVRSSRVPLRKCRPRPRHVRRGPKLRVGHENIQCSSNRQKIQGLELLLEHIHDFRRSGSLLHFMRAGLRNVDRLRIELGKRSAEVSTSSAREPRSNYRCWETRARMVR